MVLLPLPLLCMEMLVEILREANPKEAIVENFYNTGLNEKGAFVWALVMMKISDKYKRILQGSDCVFCGYVDGKIYTYQLMKVLNQFDI